MVDNLPGKYKLESSDNYDIFLKDTGIGFAVRQLIKNQRPNVEIYHIGDMWTINTIMSFKTITSIFRLGEPFEEERLDGTKVQSIVEANGPRLVWTQNGDDPEKKSIVTLELDEGNLKAVSIPVSSCLEQDKTLNLAYTIGAFCLGFSAFAWGFFLDSMGLRITRLLLKSLQFSAFPVLMRAKLVICDKSIIIVFLLVVKIILSKIIETVGCFQVANLFPKQRSTIISLYSGAFSASAVVFIFLEYAYDAGLAWRWVTSMLTICSLILLPMTMFVLPHDRIRESRPALRATCKEIAAVYPESVGTFCVLPISPCPHRKATCGLPPALPTVSGKLSGVVTVEKRRPTLPLTSSLFSSTYLMLTVWFSWLLVYTVNYAGSMALWLDRMDGHGHRQASWYIRLFGLAQLSGFVLSPLSGMIMDRGINKASNEMTRFVCVAENDPDLKRLRQYQSGFWTVSFTTVTLASILVCKLFHHEVAVYFSVAAVTVLRSLLVAVATSYLRARFPADHFNPLLGIMSTAASVASLLQFPLFVWEANSGHHILQINLFQFVMLALISAFPLQMLITPLQRHFIRQENELESKLKSGST
ncbi:hypothetical protein LAZ67_17002544 [Cordylochernes scorpioides]|uniref:Uncharacterized protein n=1 Tax=Cordylochernes scorpioides TaxID=51811 RepID=A0ABY6LE16_9ARAC|nr:hypothetical protein LAZ67_17002544 [Cordylochernes scorpioides]